MEYSFNCEAKIITNESPIKFSACSVTLNVRDLMFNEIVRKYSTASSRDAIGCEDCKKRFVDLDSFFDGQMSIGLLLLKLPGFVYILSVLLTL